MEALEGRRVGSDVGFSDGAKEGLVLVTVEGLKLGKVLGARDGIADGRNDGKDKGKLVGTDEEELLGFCDNIDVGRFEGRDETVRDGSGVGFELDTSSNVVFSPLPCVLPARTKKNHIKPERHTSESTNIPKHVVLFIPTMFGQHKKHSDLAGTFPFISLVVVSIWQLSFVPKFFICAMWLLLPSSNMESVDAVPECVSFIA